MVKIPRLAVPRIKIGADDVLGWSGVLLLAAGIFLRFGLPWALMALGAFCIFLALQVGE